MRRYTRNEKEEEEEEEEEEDEEEEDGSVRYLLQESQEGERKIALHCIALH